eukprot:3178722-Amphidinium_carterae.1
MQVDQGFATSTVGMYGGLETMRSKASFSSDEVTEHQAQHATRYCQFRPRCGMGLTQSRQWLVAGPGL